MFLKSKVRHTYARKGKKHNAIWKDEENNSDSNSLSEYKKNCEFDKLFADITPLKKIFNPKIRRTYNNDSSVNCSEDENYELRNSSQINFQSTPVVNNTSIENSSSWLLLNNGSGSLRALTDKSSTIISPSYSSTRLSDIDSSNSSNGIITRSKNINLCQGTSNEVIVLDSRHIISSDLFSGIESSEPCNSSSDHKISKYIPLENIAEESNVSPIIPPKQRKITFFDDDSIISASPSPCNVQQRRKSKRKTKSSLRRTFDSEAKGNVDCSSENDNAQPARISNVTKRKTRSFKSLENNENIPPITHNTLDTKSTEISVASSENDKAQAARILTVTKRKTRSVKSPPNDENIPTIPRKTLDTTSKEYGDYSTENDKTQAARILNVAKRKTANVENIALEKSPLAAAVAEKPRKTVVFELSSEESLNEINNSTVHDKKIIELQSGKWRKSLADWRKKYDSDATVNVSKWSHNEQSCMPRSNKVGPSTSRDHTIINQRQKSIILAKTDDGVFTTSIDVDNLETFNEDRADISYQKSLFRNRKTSVIDPARFSLYTGCDTADVAHVIALNPRELVLKRCQQSEPLEFTNTYSEKQLKTCRKIGEGVYGEVFMNKDESGKAVVLKIIPIEGKTDINGEQQKRFDEVLSEIVIAMELSNLKNGKEFMTSGFVDVVNVRCVRGRYPNNLIELWELYRDNYGTDNDHPEVFDDNQLYIVFELANAGQDLEAFNFTNSLQSYSAFLQIAITLAVAEKKLEFEHRDLHWGNILLQSTDEKEICFRLNGRELIVPTHGVKAAIIDYTLSRMVHEGCCFYNDLAHDEDLFTAFGDYQYDIYRFMKSHLGNNWEGHQPYTNILWLHYVIDKMINGARYRNSKTKKHRATIDDMMQLRDTVLDYKSCADLVKFLC